MVFSERIFIMIMFLEFINEGLLMKKVILGISLIVSFFYTAIACADDFTGLRLGVGYSHAWQEITDNDATDSEDQVKGFKIESGFDFNRVVGLDLSYDVLYDSFGNITNDGATDAATFKLGTDIGYAFYSEKAFIKPYVKLGFVSLSVADDAGYFDGNSVFAGLGVRYQYNRLYADLSADYFFIDGDDDDFSTDYYGTYLQTAFTVGYKF